MRDDRPMPPSWYWRRFLRKPRVGPEAEMEDFAARLAWVHGIGRAKFILLGLDHASNRDQVAWRGFGKRFR